MLFAALASRIRQYFVEPLALLNLLLIPKPFVIPVEVVTHVAAPSVLNIIPGSV
jgi:hypothetical protein